MAQERTRPPQSTEARPFALVVEPDPLTSWSIRSFLDKWYDVGSAATLAQARSLFEERRALALLLVADSLPDGDVGTFIEQVLQAAPGVAVVRMVVPPGQFEADAGGLPNGVRVLEKPFLLDALASLLRLPVS